MKIEVDRRIYSDSCITKAIYSLSDKYTFLRKIVSDKEVIEIESCIQNQPIVESDILNALNDYKLREIICNETHEIRTILYAKAFGDLDGLNDDGHE